MRYRRHYARELDSKRERLSESNNNLESLSPRQSTQVPVPLSSPTSTQVPIPLSSPTSTPLSLPMSSPSSISSTNSNEEKTETPPTEFAPMVDPLPNRRVSSRSNKNQTTWYDAFSLNYLQSLDWSGFLSAIDSSEFRFFVAKEFDPYEGIYECLDPMLLSVATKNRDNPIYHQAMNGPDCEGYKEAMDVEYNTLQEVMKAWDIVSRTSGSNVLGSTWAFARKLYPNGSFNKFESRFCVRGDQQIEGVDLFGTFAPVV